MQIEPTLAKLVQLNFGLSRYFWTQRIAETFAGSAKVSAKSLQFLT